jgi:hypothetical protein
MCYLSLVIVIICVVAASILAIDLISFWIDPSEYRFGTEVAGWAYYSQKNFVISGLIWIGIYTLIAVIVFKKFM